MKVSQRNIQRPTPVLTALDALHKSRLLTVEERPFKRITKRLLTSPSPISIATARLPTPPLDADSSEASDTKQKAQAELRRFREDVQLDFAAFESSIARIQFLRASNARERKRYATEKLKIQETAHAVRENTTLLRTQLAEAQKTLAIRKTYDELAHKITSNRALRPRDEQLLNLEKLRSEIEDLEREKQQYKHTWLERREQFGKLVEEGQRLRRLIRDEKEEVERREGMEEGDEADESGSNRGGRSSLVGTPRPDGGQTPLHSTAVSGGLTPAANLEQSRNASPSRHEASAMAEAAATKTPAPGIEDADMADEGEVDETEGVPVVTVTGEGMKATEEKAEDAMDTT